MLTYIKKFTLTVYAWIADIHTKSASLLQICKEDLGEYKPMTIKFVQKMSIIIHYAVKTSVLIFTFSFNSKEIILIIQLIKNYVNFINKNIIILYSSWKILECNFFFQLHLLQFKNSKLYMIEKNSKKWMKIKKKSSMK